jgi:hypothetical protein
MWPHSKEGSYTVKQAITSSNTGQIRLGLAQPTLIHRAIIGRNYGVLIPFLGTKPYYGELFRKLSRSKQL